MPGTDFYCGGEYSFGNGELESGLYQEKNSRTGENRMFRFFNIEDLRSIVSCPEKTILVCHVPRKFDNLEACIDMAEFGEVEQSFSIEGHKFPKNSVVPYGFAVQLVNAGAPIKIKKENRGNKDLKKLYEELGIKYAVSGHFHESSHRANDSLGNPVNEEEIVPELFWNSGYCDSGDCGILTVSIEGVSYKNIKLRK